jgi:hypothetical protein
MKDKEIVYWKTKDGKLVSVDDMDTNHLKNAFKHLIKHHSNVVHQANDIIEKYNTLVRKRRIERGEASFNLNGDMANEFNLEFFDEEEQSI